jgi:hypothetical protein
MASAGDEPAEGQGGLGRVAEALGDHGRPQRQHRGAVDAKHGRAPVIGAVQGSPGPALAGVGDQPKALVAPLPKLLGNPHRQGAAPPRSAVVSTGKPDLHHLGRVWPAGAGLSVGKGTHVDLLSTDVIRLEPERAPGGRGKLILPL